MPAQCDAARVETSDRILQYLGSQFRELKRNRRHRDVAAGVLLHPLRQSLVLRVANGARKPLVLDAVPPEAVDAQGLNIEALLVHGQDALVQAGIASGLFLEWRAFDDIAQRNVRVGMHIDDTNTASRDRDLPACRGRLRLARPTVSDDV